MKTSKRNHKQAQDGSTGDDRRDDALAFEGTVEEVLPSTLFKVRTTMGTEVLCTLSGRMRLHRIRLLLGDRVLLETSPYDTSRGRVTRRL